MIGEDHAINVPSLVKAAEPLPQPKGDRPATNNAQAQPDLLIGMSR